MKNGGEESVDGWGRRDKGVKAITANKHQTVEPVRIEKAQMLDKRKQTSRISANNRIAGPLNQFQGHMNMYTSIYIRVREVWLSYTYLHIFFNVP